MPAIDPTNNRNYVSFPSEESGSHSRISLSKHVVRARDPRKRSDSIGSSTRKVSVQDKASTASRTGYIILGLTLVAVVLFLTVNWGHANTLGDLGNTLAKAQKITINWLSNWKHVVAIGAPLVGVISIGILLKKNNFSKKEQLPGAHLHMSDPYTKSNKSTPFPKLLRVTTKAKNPELVAKINKRNIRFINEEYSHDVPRRTGKL